MARADLHSGRDGGRADKAASTFLIFCSRRFVPSAPLSPGPAKSPFTIINWRAGELACIYVYPAAAAARRADKVPIAIPRVFDGP